MVVFGEWGHSVYSLLTTTHPYFLMRNTFRDNAGWMLCIWCLWNAFLDGWTAHRPECWVDVRLESAPNRQEQRESVRDDLHQLALDRAYLSFRRRIVHEYLWWSILQVERPLLHRGGVLFCLWTRLVNWHSSTNHHISIWRRSLSDLGDIRIIRLSFTRASKHRRLL